MATILGGGAENVNAGPGTGASVAVAENLKGSAKAGGATTRGCAKLYIRGEGARPCWTGA